MTTYLQSRYLIMDDWQVDHVFYYTSVDDYNSEAFLLYMSE